MPKQTCRGAASFAALAILASVGFWPASAPAQTPNEPPETGVETGEPSESAVAPEPQLTREQRLDALFEELSAAEEGDHKRVEKAIRDLWAKSGSDSMDLILLRGREAMGEEELVKAIHHFTALVEHAPDFAEGWNARATAFYLRGDVGLSLADIERTLALEPRHFGALWGLGVIMEQMGRERDALAAYREALRVNPNLENAQDAIGRLATEVDGRDI